MWDWQRRLLGKEASPTYPSFRPSPPICNVDWNNNFFVFIRCKVTLTDLPEVIPLLERNIELNSGEIPRDFVKSKSLRWGEEINQNERAVLETDFVLVSDCIYYEASLDPLLLTLKAVTEASPKALILICYEDRSSSSEAKEKIQRRFFELVEAADLWSVRHYGLAECHPEFASEDIHVIGLQKKPSPQE